MDEYFGNIFGYCKSYDASELLNYEHCIDIEEPDGLSLTDEDNIIIDVFMCFDKNEVMKTKLHNAKEVADFIDTVGHVYVVDENGGLIVEAENGHVLRVDALCRNEILTALHQNDGFKDRYRW